ncbi:MAG: DUF5810 domain-containing protein [Halobacteriales archaeon]
MGYACPVCDAPQADGEHLANHLAFTAMLHGDDHADFLDAHVDGWEDRTPPELAAELIRHADEVDHETVFEDTTGGPGMGRGDGPDERAEPAADAGWSARPPAGDGPDLDALDDATLDEETARVVDEAAKLFERGDDAEDS